MDLSKLTTGDKVIAGSALAYFIFMFLPWFSLDLAGFDIGSAGDYNGFDVGFLWGVFPLLLALIMVAIVAVRAFAPDKNLPDLPFSYGQLLLGLGGLAALLVVLKLLVGEGSDVAAGFTVDFDRSYGLFLAALAAIGLAVGGLLETQEDAGAGSGPGGDITDF